MPLTNNEIMVLRHMAGNPAPITPVPGQKWFTLNDMALFMGLSSHAARGTAAHMVKKELIYRRNCHPGQWAATRKGVRVLADYELKRRM